MGGWVGQWVGPGQMTKNLINLDLIEIIQFVETPSPMGGWLNGLMSGVRSND